MPVWVVVLVVLGIIWLSWRAHEQSVNAQNATKAAAANRAYPVVTATAQSGDMPIFIEGLGSVTPFNVVTIHTRVDGQIMKLWFKEGQIVKVGDPLADIDPRPYQAALGIATLILLWRLIRRESVQPAVSGLIGVVVCALIAYMLGQSKGYFLLGIWTSLLWAAVFAVSILLRRPVVGHRRVAILPSLARALVDR